MIEGSQYDNHPATAIKTLSNFQCQTKQERTVERRSIPSQSKYLSSKALVLGAVWIVAGIAYGAIRTRAFRAEPVTLEVPSDLG
ncbi:MAG: hypothetical protein ACLPXT_03775 [Terracidiphilus sp.]